MTFKAPPVVKAEPRVLLSENPVVSPVALWVISPVAVVALLEVRVSRLPVVVKVPVEVTDNPVPVVRALATIDCPMPVVKPEKVPRT